MTPAILSLLALLVVIGFSLTARINVGVLAVALAWPIAVFAAGWKTEALMAVFPSGLFLTLLGVTLLFGIAHKNGTLEVIARHATAACGGVTGLLPIAFFALACGVSTFGPGAIAATALIAPLAMSTGATAGVPAFLMALMVANGGNAGNLSPFSAVGVIVQSLLVKIGLGGHEWGVFSANFVAHALVAAAAYMLFGGLPLWRLGRGAGAIVEPPPSFASRHVFTCAVIALWIAAVVVWRTNPGLSAFAAAAVLIIARAADDTTVVGAVPWSVILMVCGVSVLVGVIEKTGGMDLFTTLLARITSPATANGMMAFVTGVISTYSSTSGVVYPAFLPAVPGLVEKLGGGDPLEIALSINVGAAIVDVSPLSTIGALCIAALPNAAEARVLFRQMLLWGFAMTVVGAVFCQLAIRFFAF
ncbi:MAG: SLC13 family permease [Opitutaceae bacterium]|nr:SLC13 family permease [Opitutaceae bacterium]